MEKAWKGYLIFEFCGLFGLLLYSSSTCEYIV